MITQSLEGGVNRAAKRTAIATKGVGSAPLQADHQSGLVCEYILQRIKVHICVSGEDVYGVLAHPSKHHSVCVGGFQGDRDHIDALLCESTSPRYPKGQTIIASNEVSRASHGDEFVS